MVKSIGSSIVDDAIKLCVSVAFDTVLGVDDTVAIDSLDELVAGRTAPVSVDAAEVGGVIDKLIGNFSPH